MAFETFGPICTTLGPDETTADDVAKQIIRNDMIPAFSNVANWILRREDDAAKVNNATKGETAAKMLDIWQEVYELLYRRVGEEFPEVLQGDPPSVRDAWRW